MSSSRFPKLFTPLRLHGGALLLKNRAMMGSMHTGLEEGDGWGHRLDKMAGFFAERAAGGVALCVTGGIAPNAAGRVYPFAASMLSASDARRHRVVTEAVHATEGAKIAMQLLHAGRYAYSPAAVAPSAKKAPIGWFTPRALSGDSVRRTVDDFVRAACLAEEAGYDGVEVMGSEGYLINQFLVSRTNQRTDEWGGSVEKRMRLALEIVSGIREATSDKFLIIFRLSMLDLVEGGSSWPEVVELAQAIEAAGASIINTGIGWHEARVPTIATAVPRGGFSWVTAKLRGSVSIPLVATNRINTPEIAESILERGDSDLVSMARPFLADPNFMAKAEAGSPERINTCIACNQACLDHTFQMKRASCLVNPRAGYETELIYEPAPTPLKVAVVGAGPAGLACATVAARRGHEVTLLEASDQIGGQFNYAKQIPGKEEFHETIRYFRHEISESGVKLQLNEKASVESLSGFDKVVLATGVLPRSLSIPGAHLPAVVSYADVLARRCKVGERVAVIGAGGIGFDVCEFLLHGADRVAADAPLSLPTVADFLNQWQIDPKNETRGGLLPREAASVAHPSRREIHLLQRKKGKHGAGLGKTTGWIHRASLKRGNVQMIGGVSYERIDSHGDALSLKLKRKDGSEQTIVVDTVVVCAGQESEDALEKPLREAGVHAYTIGGARLAAELDAKRAIDQGSRLAATIESATPADVEGLTPPLTWTARLYELATSRADK